MSTISGANGETVDWANIDPELPYLLDLEIGDWSRDGHEKSETIVIASNLDSDAIMKAYKAGAKKIGVDCMKEVCAEYEDNKLSEAHWRLYIAAGICTPPFDWVSDAADDPQTGDGIDWIDYEAYTDLFLLTVLCGNPKFRFVYPVRAAKSMPIGGYGVFH